MAIHESSATTYRGHHCLEAPDFGALGFSAGQKMTLQTRWRAGTADTTLYQCSDIELVDAASYVPPAGRDGMCFNGALDVATVDTNDYSDDLGSGGLSGVSILYLRYSLPEKKILRCCVPGCQSRNRCRRHRRRGSLSCCCLLRLQETEGEQEQRC